MTIFLESKRSFNFWRYQQFLLTLIRQELWIFKKLVKLAKNATITDSSEIFIFIFLVKTNKFWQILMNELDKTIVYHK